MDGTLRGGDTVFLWAQGNLCTKKNWKILDSFKHRRSSDWSLPSELGDLRNSFCISPCHFSYENEEGSGWTLLALPELRENELSWAGLGIFWWFLCRETQASGCKVAGTDCAAAAWELALESFLLLALQALAQLRVSTLIYTSTHPAKLSLALAELNPPKHM